MYINFKQSQNNVFMPVLDPSNLYSVWSDPESVRLMQSYTYICLKQSSVLVYISSEKFGISIALYLKDAHVVPNKAGIMQIIPH